MANIEIKLIAEIAQAAKEIASFTKGAEKNLNELEKSATSVSDGISSAFTGLAATAISALGAISFKELTTAGAEAESAIVRLQSALRLAGESTDSGPYVALARSIKDLLGVDDEFVLSQITLLKNLGATNVQIQDIITTAADLSSVLGQDLGVSVQQLASTFSGTLPRSLPKLLSGLKGLTEEQLKAGAGLQFISDRLKGFASTVQDSSKILQATLVENLHNVVEETGKLIVQSPLYINALKAANTALVSIAHTIEEGGLAKLAEFFTRAAVAAGVFFLVFRGNAILSSLFAINAAIIGIIRSLELARIASALFKASLTFGLTLIIDQLVQVGFYSESIGDFFTNAGLKAKQFGLIASVAVLDFIKYVSDLVKKFPALSKVFGNFSDNVDDFRNDLNNSLKETNATIKNIQNRGLEKPFHEASGAVSGLRSNVAGLGNDVTQTLKEIEQEARDRIGGLSNLDFFKLTREGKTLGFTIDFANTKDLAALGVGVFKQLTQGLQGAISLFSKGVGLAVEAFAPGFGQAASEIFAILAQGPEKLKEMIDQFISSIPTILQNVILASAASTEIILEAVSKLPEILLEAFNGLAERFPELIERLLERLPEFITRFVEGAIKLGVALAAQAPFIATRIAVAIAAQTPTIAQEFITNLIKETPRLITEMIKQFGQSVGGAFGIGGGGGGGILGGIGDVLGNVTDIFGFASGGLIQGGPPFTDRIPALVQPGEFITDRSLTQELQSFLAQNKNTETERPTQAPTQVSGTTTMVVNLQLGEKQLAQALLDLSRGGFRTA